MKLLRYGAKGKEKPGLVDKDGRIRDLSGVVADISGETIAPKGLARLAKINPESLRDMVTNYEELAGAVSQTEFAGLLA